VARLKTRQQLEGIQYLRAIAAFMVLVFHLSFYCGPFLRTISARLPSGVDIFFVISGFIMLITSQRATPLSFMGRRILRIVPLYWLLTLVIFAAALPTAQRHAVGELVKSLLFVPYLDVRGSGDRLPIISPGWSLNLEMYFYVLFAVTLWAPLRRWAVVILGVLFTTLILCHDATSIKVAQFYMQSRIIEFWAGMALGWLYLHGGMKASPVVALAAIGVGFVALVAFNLPFQVPAMLLVAGMICLEAAGHLPRWPLLGYLGDASYSTYLSHGAVIEVAYQLWRHTHLSAALFAPVGLLAGVCGGVLCYRYLETPLLTLWRRRRTDRAAPASTGVAAAPATR
jgi:exopolysaccharide production protein ExoZ